MMPEIPIAAVAGLAAVTFGAHLYTDHIGQPAAWAATKGGCTHAGRIACAKHVGVVVIGQALAVGLTVAVTTLDLNLVSILAGLFFTGWSHYWFDRRFTARGLYRAYNKVGFADMGTPRPGHDDAPHLGTGAYRMDQDWHYIWLTITAVIMAAPAGALLVVLVTTATGVMAAAILASRWGRARLAQEQETTAA